MIANFYHNKPRILILHLFTDTAAILNEFDLKSIIGCPGGHDRA